MKTQDYEVTIPKGTGRAGFLKAIDAMLRLPRVQSISIDAAGKVSCTRILQPNEQAIPLEVDFESLSPYAIIRNATAVELSIPVQEMGASDTVAHLFQALSQERLFPLGFVTGVNTVLWKWLSQSTGINPPVTSEEEFFGVPVYRDRAVEDYVLFLCGGYMRGSSLTDTQRAFKVLMLENNK